VSAGIAIGITGAWFLSRVISTFLRRLMRQGRALGLL
jgi:hypothetical protein